jgi:hypothetical protein
LFCVFVFWIFDCFKLFKSCLERMILFFIDGLISMGADIPGFQITSRIDLGSYPCTVCGHSQT